MKAKLTKRNIEGITPGEKDTFLWDTDLPMFGIKVTPAGRRVYILQYRAGGKVRRYTIGLHGPLTPDLARQKAIQLLAEVVSGQDPASAKGEARKGPTVADLAARYLSEHAEIKKKASSVAKDKQWLNRFILPTLGNRKVSDITRTDISDFHYSMRETPYQANRTFEVLRKMFNLAERWGYRTDGTNPCRHVEKYKEKKRERFLSKQELARLEQTLNEAEANGEMPSAILAIRLLLLTGARLSEILTLKWDYIDFELGFLSLPDSKTGAKLIPLPTHAIKLLTKAPRIEQNPYVCFGVKTGSYLIGLQKIWGRIRSKAGIEEVRLHDLRHSFASIAAAAGLSLPLIGALLGHSQAQTTKRYAHLAIDPLKAATEEVAKRIDAAMNQSNVIAIRRV